MAALNELEIRLIVKSEVDKEFKKAGEAAKKFEKQADSSVKKVSKGFGKLKTAIEGAMGAAIIRQGAELIKSSEKMGISLAVLRVKSSSVADVLERTSELTFGLANKFDMVSAANKAMSFGIDLSNGRLEKLMKLSAKTATVMGTDVKSAFDDLITGVARESKMILDNLGIMVDLNKVYKTYAKQLKISVGSLTKAQKQTALLDEVNKQLAISTAAVTDQMINAGTQGTQALKNIETAGISVVNILAKGFVGLGTVIGESLARAQGFHVVTDEMKERTKWEQATYDLALKRQDEIRARGEFANIHHELAQVRREQSFKHWMTDINKKKAVEKKRILDIAKNKAQLVGLKSSISKALDVGGTLSEKLYEGFTGNEAERRWKNANKKEKAGAREFSRIKEDLIRDIISFEKERTDFEELGNVDRLNAKVKFAALEKELATKGQKELTEQRMTLAIDADKTARVQAGKEAMEKLEQAVSDSEERKFQEKLSWNKQTDKMLSDYAKIELDREKKKKEDAEKIGRDRKAKRDLEEEEFEKHFGTLKSYGDEYLQAVLQGNIDMIPQILAQQAMRIGTEMIWDGTKGVWKGIVMNAEVPGSGVPLMTAGFGEIAAGGVIAAAGGVASNALSSDPSGAESGSKERNDTSSREQAVNLNAQFSLYGGKTQAKRELNDVLRN